MNTAHNIKWYGDNNVDASFPKFWAFKGMDALYENMVWPFLVNTNYENLIQEAGDSIQITKPLPFATQRTGDYVDKRLQDAKLDKITAVLDQPYDVTFILKDRERSLSQEELISRFAVPATMELAQTINRKLSLTAMLTAYAANHISGGLGTMSGTNARSFVLDANLALNNQKCPPAQRQIIWTPQQMRYLQDTSIYFAANQRGDGGVALREAMLGRVDAFDHYMTQSGSSISGFPVIQGAINHVGGYLKGATTLVVNGFSTAETAAVKVGAWVTIAGDATPYRITAIDLGSGTDLVEIEIDRGLRNPVAHTAVVSVTTTDTVATSTTFPIGHEDYVTLTGSVTPQVGQMISFDETGEGPVYGIMDVTTSGILLDRALEAAVANGAQVNFGPNGEYGIAMRPDFVTFYSRPQVQNEEKTGAAMYSASAFNIALRAVLQYEALKKGMIVSYDILCGAKGLDADQGVLVLG